MGDQIREKFKDFLDKKLLIDVNFVFKSKARVVHTVPAHKLVLTACSPVFETMFTGSIPEILPEVIINDPEIDFKNFKAFIQYFYTKKIDINLKNAAPLAYLAHKYQVTSLEDECHDFFVEKLSNSNVYDILKIADLYRMDDLKDDCFELISTSAEAQREEVFSKLTCEQVIGVIENLPQVLREDSMSDRYPQYHISLKERVTQNKTYMLLQAIKNWLRTSVLGKT